MESRQRRRVMLEKLTDAGGPITGSELARSFGVSRQVVVGDVAILRAAGHLIYATPQGYMLPAREAVCGVTAQLACRHGREELAAELEIMIDNGLKIIDVIVEHPLYGEIKANLMLTSRRDLDSFMTRLEVSGAHPLSLVTGGVHLHTVEAPSPAALANAKAELKRHGILME